MDEAEQNAYFKERLVDLSGPLVREALIALGFDPEEGRPAAILCGLCLRLYNAGVRDGAAEIAAQAIERGVTVNFVMGITVPDGPLGDG